MAASHKRVSVERVIAAPPEVIFDVLADPTKHPVIDGSGTVKSARGNTGRLSLGSKFGMGMRIGLPYIVRNTVVEFEEGRRIGWRHISRDHIWRYDVAAQDGGTLVTETFDWGPALHGFALAALKVPQRHKLSMARTLERLDKLVTTGTVG